MQRQNSSPYGGMLLLYFGFIIASCVILKRWLRCRKCKSTIRIDGKTVIVTGSNAGIGKETAKDLARRGGRVIIACRDTRKGFAAANEIRTEIPSATVRVKQLDLSSFSSVRRFAEDILTTEPYVHILINNAGVIGEHKKTQDGFEMQFGVNHLGHFLLTLLLLDKMKESAPSRIINVSSVLHAYGSINFDDLNCNHDFYGSLKSYCRSKLANILFTRELAKRLHGTGVTAYSLHPGSVRTDITRHLDSPHGRLVRMGFNAVASIFFVTPEMGAQTSVYCATDESLAAESGYYYRDCCREEPALQAKDDETAERLWEVSEKLVGLSS